MKDKEKYNVELTDKQDNKKEVITKAWDSVEKKLNDPNFDPEKELLSGIAKEIDRQMFYGSFCNFTNKKFMDDEPVWKHKTEEPPTLLDFALFLEYKVNHAHWEIEKMKKELPGGEFYKDYTIFYPESPRTQEDINEMETIWSIYYDLYGEAYSAAKGLSKEFVL